MTPRVRSQGEPAAGSSSREVGGPRTDAGGRASESFLLRVSAEPREARGSRRRLTGFVSHLGTGEEAHFSDVETLVAWLQSKLKEEFGRSLDDRGTAEREVPARGRGRRTTDATAGEPSDPEGDPSANAETGRRRRP